MAKKNRKIKLGEHEQSGGSQIGKDVTMVAVFALAIVSLLSIFDLAGKFGNFLYRILELAFGWGFWIFPLVLLTVGYLSLLGRQGYFSAKNWLGTFLMVIGYSGFFHLTQDPDKFKEVLNQGDGGGYIGFGLAWPLFKIMGRWAAMVVSSALFLIGFMVMCQVGLKFLLSRLFSFLSRKKDEVAAADDGHSDASPSAQWQEEQIDEGTKEGVAFEEKEVGEVEAREADDDVARENSTESLPPIMKKSDEEEKPKRRIIQVKLPFQLLSDKSEKPTAKDVETTKRVIQKTLSNFGIEVEMGEVAVGPTVTQYTLRPAEGIKLSRIVGLSNDLALALAAHPIRIEAPIPGKPYVGIEVPNQKIAVVNLREVLETKEFQERKSNLSIVLGKDVAGKPWIADLQKLPHLLVAGATNSGKTVCLNTIIVSLLYQNQPDELKLILVDPKRVEMPIYNGIPYLLTSVVTDVKKTIGALKWTIGEMERRFHILSGVGKRNIQSYNDKFPQDKLPYIVFIIDELADLMSVASAEVEAAIIRLAQMARAVGIHLILATQRPSVDIITGLIKANIPGRIAFYVASLIDSRTILDESGAEKLLGRGDMLYSSADSSKPKRIQGAYCSDRDIENVVRCLREQVGQDHEYKDVMTEQIESEGLGGVVLEGSENDDQQGEEYLFQARELIVDSGKASASFLQRRLKIGYARAARILDMLEERGVVGPVDGAKPRQILVKKGELSQAEQAERILTVGAKGVYNKKEPYWSREPGNDGNEKNDLYPGAQSVWRKIDEETQVSQEDNLNYIEREFDGNQTDFSEEDKKEEAEDSFNQGVHNQFGDDEKDTTSISSKADTNWPADEKYKF